MEFLGRFLRGATPAGRLPGFAGAAGWINSDPLADADLRGKVVLVDFWTYTCINWLRTLSHVRAWSERYGEHGLVAVGVHTPEFPFERDEANVNSAAWELGVSYPIALDPDYSVWGAFANRYWPAVYIADAEGRIRHHQFGEGGYEECERVIQGLLGDAGRVDVPDDLVAPAADGLEAQADWENLRSPETYLNEPPTGVEPDRLRLNQWSLTGDWAVESRASVLNGAGGEIAFRFHARDLHLVMGPPADDAAVPFRVRIDGEPPGEDHGLDVDEGGGRGGGRTAALPTGSPTGSITDRKFEITFLAPGVEAYVFTFG